MLQVQIYRPRTRARPLLEPASAPSRTPRDTPMVVCLDEGWLVYRNRRSPNDAAMDSKVTVAVRCRPLMPREQRDGAESVVALEDRRVAVGTRVELKRRAARAILGRSFSFDLVLGGDSQQQVHETLGVPLLRHAWRGLNASIFAYGQTGSGKTYSMTGGDVPSWRGIIPRVCEGLWDAADAHSQTHETTVEASYMEVYNERVRDLLVPTGRPLKVREHPTKGACVP